MRRKAFLWSLPLFSRSTKACHKKLSKNWNKSNWKTKLKTFSSQHNTNKIIKWEVININIVIFYFHMNMLSLDTLITQALVFHQLAASISYYIFNFSQMFNFVESLMQETPQGRSPPAKRLHNQSLIICKINNFSSFFVYNVLIYCDSGFCID